MNFLKKQKNFTTVWIYFLFAIFDWLPLIKCVIYIFICKTGLYDIYFKNIQKTLSARHCWEMHTEAVSLTCVICIQVFLNILNTLAIRPVTFLTRAVFLYDYFWVCSFFFIFSLYDIHELSNLTRICLLIIIYILFNLLIYSICCYTCTKKCCFVTCLHLYKEKLNFVLIWNNKT